jgi:hypothetical protein
MSLGRVASALGIGATTRAFARALSADGRPLTVVALSRRLERALSRAGHKVTRLEPTGPLELVDRAADALCADSLSSNDAAAAIGEWMRVVRDRGRVLIATSASSRRQPRHYVCALFLHAGLRDVEQTLAGGIVITSGRVRW